jgi:hypothetical protein
VKVIDIQTMTRRELRQSENFEFSSFRIFSTRNASGGISENKKCNYYKWCALELEPE